MLGKPTFAYPTAYAKLEAVYAHSVRQWAHVQFVTELEPLVKTESRMEASAPCKEPCRQSAT